MTADHAHRRLGLQSRLVSVALCTVLALLGGLGVLQAVVGSRATERLERSGDLVEAYLVLNQAVAQQDAIEDGYEDDPDPRKQRRFAAASARIAGALETLRTDGGDDDAALARRIADTSRRYDAGLARFFVAVDAGDDEEAERIDEELIDASGVRLSTLVTQSGPAHATESLHGVDALRRSQRSLLVLTLIAFPVGILVLLGLGWVLRALRRRLAAAQAEEVAHLEHAALTDSLTGIGNHRAFEEALARDLARAERNAVPLALIMLDLDGLKAVNDSGGHQAGDRMIKAVAAALHGTARAGDSVFRIGGDEYAAVLPATSAWGAFELVQRVHHQLADEGVFVSAGIAAADGPTPPDDLIAAADAALMTAKREGRDTVIHADGMDVPGRISREDADRRHQTTLAAALARAVDAKDSWTQSHCETVSELCGLIAVGLGLDDERVDAVRLAGLVHDVGKIGVPDAILQKPSRLDAEEFETVKQHAALGHRILAGTELTREAPWVLHHHERIDGKGYPAGLSGADIPLESRIIHVADAFEAMTSDRPYRAGMPHGEAIAELHRHAGTQFDADCVDALVAAVAAPRAAVGA